MPDELLVIAYRVDTVCGKENLLQSAWLKVAKIVFVRVQNINTECVLKVQC